MKSSAKFAGTIKNGCYVCRLNNHIHQQCVPLNEFKRLALVAKESTDTSTVSARANHTKDDQSVNDNVDKDNVINNNVTNYLVSFLDSNSLKSNLVLSSQPANSYITSLKSKIEYVEDCNSNIFSSSQVNNFLTVNPTINHTIPSHKKKVNKSTHLNNNIQHHILDTSDKILSNIAIGTKNKMSTDSKVDNINQNKVINHQNIDAYIDKNNTIQSSQKKAITTNKNNTPQNKKVNNKSEHDTTSTNLVNIVDLTKGGFNKNQ